MDKKNVPVNNLCGWPLYFKRATGQGDVEIPARVKGFQMLSFDEVLAQIQIGNPIFVGTDGMGGHARVEIIDDEQRKELFGFSDDGTSAPAVLNEESVRDLLAIRSKAKFDDRLNELVKTSAEKKMLVEIAFSVGGENAETWKVDKLRALADTANL